MTPALLTHTSIRPKRSAAWRARSCTASLSVTSVGTTSARPPAALHSSAVSRRLCSLRAASTTLAPCSARACAVVLPMPLEAPVMTTTESPSARRTPFTSSLGRQQLRFEDALDGAILLFLEDLVGVRSLIERKLMGGEILDTQRIVVAAEQRHDVVYPPLDVRLAHADLDAPVEEVHHGQGVGLAAVDAD